MGEKLDVISQVEDEMHTFKKTLKLDSQGKRKSYLGLPPITGTYWSALLWISQLQAKISDHMNSSMGRMT